MPDANGSTWPDPTDRPFDPAIDYPLAERRPDLVSTPMGKPLAALTLEAVLAGEVDAADIRVSRETLELQARVAAAAGRAPLARALRRAAELTALPDEEIMATYEALRPRRATKEALLALADRLEAEHDAPINAAFVREATAAYERRGLLAGS